MKNSDRLATGSKRAPGDLAFVQGFVNTIDLESGKDDIATPGAAAAWFERHGFVASGTTVSENDHGRVLAFREALRALLRANNGDELDEGAVATLQEVAATTPMTFQVTGGGTLELQAATDGGVAAALGELQAVAYAAMLEGTWPRLKACANHACQWAFFDHSRNHSGTWCSMEVCGNRMKVRSHRERKASD
jgi:predicted RNA-binding Zn ribbon-like protein